MEDDLKGIGTPETDAALSEKELFLWCVDQLAYFVLPHYLEFRAELPHSPVTWMDPASPTRSDD